MKLKVVFNKDISFSNFLRHIINLHKWPWTRRGPLADLPEDLIREAECFSMPLKLSYERHPLADLREGVKRFKKVIKRAEKIHDKKWKEHLKELWDVRAFLEEVVKKHGDLIVNLIQKTTKIRWPYKEVWIVPSVYVGGTTVDNKIFVGYRNRSEGEVYQLLVHELIHVNTLQQEKELGLKFPMDSREITTVFFTNKVIRKLNKQLRIGLPFQEFHGYYRHLIRNHENRLRELAKNKRSYISLIKAVDEYLVKVGYPGFYQCVRIR